MAIWPFGRKNKRHTIQLGDPETPDPSPAHGVHHAHRQHSQHPSVPESMASLPPPDAEPRLPRKKSKRQKNRHSQPAIHDPSISSLHDVVATTSASHLHLPHHPPSTAHSDQPPRSQRNQLQKRRNPGNVNHLRFDDLYASRSNTQHQQQQPAMSRSLSVKGKRNDAGHAVLKKRISQRKLNKIVREQEIRLMASVPIDIPRRAGEQLGVKRPSPRTRSRRAERHRSDTSLSVRDSAASSLSDNSDPNNNNTYKVNALAQFTPRPLIRYVEAPRLPPSRSQNASSASARRERLPALTVSEENLHSRRRVDRLADGLDAGGLRELLERDRRRQEQKTAKDQERLQRKLERSAERQHQTEQPTHDEAAAAPMQSERSAVDRGRGTVTRDEPSMAEAPQPDKQPGSWLRAPSKEPPRSNRESLENVHVIGNIDDSSIREPPKLGQRPSFAPSSQEMGISRTTLSPAQSQSPSRHGVTSPTSSLIYGLARESMSDASRTVDSENHMSDHSGRRMNTFSSLFRRGSSRLKQTYRERFQDQTSDLSTGASHASRESFTRIPTQSSGPAPSIPPRPFPMSTGTVKRSQSKFTEHFGDEPLSPPDSRLQSPDIAEEPRGVPIGTAFPIPGSSEDLPARRRHRSWISDTVDEADNVPLSQSLASIDSEGSWMSGHFLRRISQRQSSHRIRHSTGQFEGTEGLSPQGDDVPSFVRFSTNEEERTSGDAADEPDNKPDLSRLPDEDPAETWHREVGRRPVLVNPTVRPKSTEGMLKNVHSLSPISAEEEFSPIEEHSAELDYATDEEQHAHN